MPVNSLKRTGLLVNVNEILWISAITTWVASLDVVRWYDFCVTRYGNTALIMCLVIVLNTNSFSLTNVNIWCSPWPHLFPLEPSLLSFHMQKLHWRQWKSHFLQRFVDEVLNPTELKEYRLDEWTMSNTHTQTLPLLLTGMTASPFSLKENIDHFLVCEVEQKTFCFEHLRTFSKKITD